MSVCAKNALILASAAPLPTKSSTTAVIAGWPPWRSYSDFDGIDPMPCIDIDWHAHNSSAHVPAASHARACPANKRIAMTNPLQMQPLAAATGIYGESGPVDAQRRSDAC